MILVGIDVAKDKHDCFIMNSDGEILAKAFSLGVCQNLWLVLYYLCGRSYHVFMVSLYQILW